MPTQPISYVKSHLADAITGVRESGEPMRITRNGVTTAVLLDAETYERTQQAMVMLELVAQSERDIQGGKVVAQADLFATMRERYVAAPETKSVKRRKRSSA